MNADHRFPHQSQIGGAAKIPTVIYYNKEGQIKAIGAETTLESVENTAEMEQWYKAVWCVSIIAMSTSMGLMPCSRRFKLHLQPGNLGPSLVHSDIPPLPPNKSAVQVLSDFLRYLLVCSREYIVQTMPNGQEFWDSVQDTIHFVLTHPNGWTGPQQRLIRNAAILAELVSDTLEDHWRIEFVTEGEGAFLSSLS